MSIYFTSYFILYLLTILGWWMWSAWMTLAVEINGGKTDDPNASWNQFTAVISKTKHLNWNTIVHTCFIGLGYDKMIDEG